MNKTLIGGPAAVVVVAAAVFYVYGSGKGKGTGSQAAASPASAASGAGGPPVSITSVKTLQRDFEVQLEATGTVMATSSVDVRPQVSSVITRVHVKEGQFVKAGQLLFTLDARTDEANVAKAQAQLARDQAALADAQRQLARSRELLAQKFISQAAVDTNLAAVEAQQAGVAADKVAIEAARVGLGYGRITAPGGGRVGAINVFVGSSVQANTTTLVNITPLDPIFVGFNLPQRNVADALQSLRGGGGRVTAVLPDAKANATSTAKPTARGPAELIGKLQFVDSAVDAGSGTVKVKAVFDNPGQALWPGAFVNVKMTVQTLKDAVVVPQAAVVQGPRGRTVYVVEAGNKAVARPVELLQSAGLDAVVSGVRAGERVVVDGRQNIRPGSTVVERAAESARGARGAASGAAGASPAASGAGALPNSVPQP